MHTRRVVFTVGLGITFCAAANAQTTPARDPTAIALLQSSIAAMATSVPADSVASGTVQIVAGSKTDNGTIRVLTRGVDQSAEQIQLTDSNRELVYSRGLASEIVGTAFKSLQFELAVTSQCPDFPLALLSGALSNPDFAFQYIGLETVDGVAVQHIRFWNTFASQANLQPLTEFSIRELWLDTTTGLPHKLAYNRREARGAAPRIPVEVFYSNYQSTGGVLYPLLIQKSLNGTPWATIRIGSVAFNTGLTDSDFPVQ